MNKSVGTRSPTQSLRYTGIPRKNQEGCPERASARVGETRGDGDWGVQGGDPSAVRRFHPPLPTVPPGGRALARMGSYSEAARRCGKLI